MLKTSFRKTSALVAGLSLAASAVFAGPVVIDGTDANDHGFFDGANNQDGWLYMQRVLENLGAGVINGQGNENKRVYILGTSGGQAGAAIDSAFDDSSLAGAGGWTRVHVDGAAALTAFFGSIAAGPGAAGILYIPTFNNSSGDLAADELAVINANATVIRDFVGGYGNALDGGGLFAMAETGPGSFAWLSTLIPGIVFTDFGGGGISTPITLTAAGAAAFPGLPAGDVANAIPWHGAFSGNLGSLSVLGTAVNSGTRNVIIGGGVGTIINPTPVPDGGATALLLAPALLGLLALRRKK